MNGIFPDGIPKWLAPIKRQRDVMVAGSKYISIIKEERADF